MDEIRVRFAPSPTGPLHIGGARSALFNYLFAKNMGGKLIMRIEDTDLERSNQESEKNIMDSLKWLGIHWDEGVDVGGDYGPYRQTERLSSYGKYIDELLETGQAYHCYCTAEELEEEREGLLAKGQMPRYMGRCSQLTTAEAEELKSQGRKPVIRFRVPTGKTIVINDLVRGDVSFESDGIGDFVIIKSDGIPTYNFAVVVDDYLMKISHVIRAEEHLSNTPRQILIYQALNLPQPAFAHVSLILGKDRSKMSKRHGSTSVVEYMEQGYLPEALVNFLALLGWSPEGEEEIFSMEELCRDFSLNRVAKNPAVFDVEKLNWINGFYIRKTPIEEIAELAIPYLQKAGYLKNTVLDQQERERLVKIMNAIKDYLHNMSEVIDHVGIFYREKIEFESDKAKEVLTEEQVPRVLEFFWNKINKEAELEEGRIKEILKETTKELELGGRKVFMPLRVALTGQMRGPELYDIIPILGKQEIRKRFQETSGLSFNEIQ